jgi:ankyrin repeat protein
MRDFNPKLFAVAGAVLLLLFVRGTVFEHRVRTAITADEFTRAIATHRTSLIDLYFRENLDPNARGAFDSPLMVAAAEQGDWGVVHRLIDAGASVDLADKDNFTPLMAAAAQGRIDILRELIGRVTNLGAVDGSGRTALQYAIISRNTEAVNLLLAVQPVVEDSQGQLLETALGSGSATIVGAIAERLPVMRDWTTGTRRALQAAIESGDRDLVRLLLKKHAAPPTPEGKNVPLLAYAIASHDANLFNTLMACGADANTTLPAHYDPDFLGILPKKFCNYISDDKNVTVLMLAAGLGQTDAVQALLDAGADRNRATGRYKMLALYLAAETGQWRCTQMLLGSGPAPEKLHIEISLASQHVSLVKDGVPIFSTVCSSGRPGFATHAGDYVITDKERNHRSTIYHVDMPYFMRLSCLDFGMHEGVVPNYPASHGCIRLPGDAAKRLFAEIPIGTLVTVK